MENLLLEKWNVQGTDIEGLKAALNDITNRTRIISVPVSYTHLDVYKRQYVYEDVDVLKNLAGIKGPQLLREAEADITNLAMTAVYNQTYAIFDMKTLQEIHYAIFGQIYDWAGEFRTIQMVKMCIRDRYRGPPYTGHFQ